MTAADFHDTMKSAITAARNNFCAMAPAHYLSLKADDDNYIESLKRLFGLCVTYSSIFNAAAFCSFQEHSILGRMPLFRDSGDFIFTLDFLPSDCVLLVPSESPATFAANLVEHIITKANGRCRRLSDAIDDQKRINMDIANIKREVHSMVYVSPAS